MAGQITQEIFGKTKDGQNVQRYTLKNKSESLEVKILDYAGTISEINVPDRNGLKADIIPGFDDFEGFESNEQCCGALVGRVANRVAQGKFVLEGKKYNLHINNGPNTLHGGKVGFHKKLWSGRIEGDELLLTYVSADGEEGFPGELTVTVGHRATEDGSLVLRYAATTTRTTHVNLTSHGYFNLAGHDGGVIDDHLLTVHADSYLPVDENSIPTGEIRKVEGTEFDLRRPVRLGGRMYDVTGGKSFDHNFCLPSHDESEPRLAARVEHPASGRWMECLTTEPGLQVYTGFYFDVAKAKGGAHYKPYSALALEAQHYPDSPNQPSFPSTVLRPGETYNQTTVYKFGST